MTRLEVLNACLATMGEKPLNSLNDPHPMRSAALGRLYTENRRRQAKGVWFNQEEITLDPSPADSRIYLPGDAISFRAPTRDTAIRAKKLYDLKNGTNLFTDSISGQLIRLVPFEDLPESAAAYYAAEVVLKFQMDYDGDSTKTRQLAADRDDAKVEYNIDHTRNRKTNLINSNVALSRLKSLSRRIRVLQYTN